VHHGRNHRPDDDQALVRRIRKWPEQDRVHQREDRGVRADADGDQGHDEQAEAGLAPHHPQPVPDILGNRIEDGETARVAEGFAGLIDAAEPPPRLAPRLPGREPLALGARPSALVGRVVREGLAPVVAGLALGLAGALAAGRLIQGLLYDVSASEPGAYVVVLTILAIVAIVACYVPARRIMRIDPVQALRWE